MTEQEIEQVLSAENACIIAPAGHGKTEMIADLVMRANKKVLVITHTNAGVDALKKRFVRKSIDAKKYSLTTIAGLCIKWCNSYPQSGHFNQELSPERKDEIHEYYQQLYIGAERIFSTAWAGIVLKNTYDGVIVDEYQDCTLEQHAIMCSINKHIPVWVLGDPLQGIFGWAGKLVDWDEIGFQRFPVTTHPWRWEATCPALGSFLESVREQLLPSLHGKAVSLDIKDEDFVEIIPASNYNPYYYLRRWQRYDSVLYISKMEHQQLQFCKTMKGIFQQDEKQDNEILYSLAYKADTETGCKLILSHIDFFKQCASNVDKEIKSFTNRLAEGSLDFHKIKKNSEFGGLVTNAVRDCSAKNISAVYAWLAGRDSINIYRRELLEEALRSLRYAERNQCTVRDAVYAIRSDAKLQKRYTSFKFLSSRTVLSKGLEFDCVVIDMRDPLGVKDFYVAMTRAKRKIFIVSDQRRFTF